MASDKAKMDIKVFFDFIIKICSHGTPKYKYPIHSITTRDAFERLDEIKKGCEAAMREIEKAQKGEQNESDSNH